MGLARPEERAWPPAPPRSPLSQALLGGPEQVAALCPGQGHGGHHRARPAGSQGSSGCSHSGLGDLSSPPDSSGGQHQGSVLGFTELGCPLDPLRQGGPCWPRGLPRGPALHPPAVRRPSDKSRAQGEVQAGPPRPLPPPVLPRGWLAATVSAARPKANTCTQGRTTRLRTGLGQYLLLTQTPQSQLGPASSETPPCAQHTRTGPGPRTG